MEGLQTLLSDPTKMVLFHYVCQLLPEDAQTEFDRLAAASLREEGGVAGPRGDMPQEGMAYIHSC